VMFGADKDEFALSLEARELPVIHADNYLNDLLLKYSETVLAERRGDVSPFRTKVENAISSLLPHGRVLVAEVARTLGISERTLGRRLADEGLNTLRCFSACATIWRSATSMTANCMYPQSRGCSVSSR
jgi:hypothetical protein